MELEIKKIKRIYISSIIEIIIQLLFYILAIAVIIFLTMTSDTYKDPYGNISFTYPQLWISFFVISFILIIMNTILSTVLLVTSWESEYPKKNNKLWGLLAMFLLGSIALLIFSKTSLKKNKLNNDKNY